MKLSSINVKSVIATIKYMSAFCITRFYKNDCWIISERPTQARDNGYRFFKYMREKHPNKQTYYLIHKKAKDYKKISKYGNIIQFDSFKHYLLYCQSKIHISAHVNGCCPNGAIGISRRTKNLLGFKDVFVPHGVSYSVSEFCLKKYADINLFICSGKPEYDNVLANYGYSENEVSYTGFPRLDGWHNVKVKKNQILLMPTWRLYLAQNPNTVFEQTKYYGAYQSVLKNKRLSDFLVANDLELVFYLHNDMRKYVGSFCTDCPNIEIVDSDEKYDIQELLKSAALMVTDYSSVHFDFAYMEKPIVYYQFDQDEFYTKQYKNSGFHAETDGFGPVVYDDYALVNEIMLAYKNNFEMPLVYKNKMLNFYELHDDKNCDRVYERILKLGF